LFFIRKKSYYLIGYVFGNFVGGYFRPVLSAGGYLFEVVGRQVQARNQNLLFELAQERYGVFSWSEL
jgi:hypothetical protein